MEAGSDVVDVRQQAISQLEVFSVGMPNQGRGGKGGNMVVIRFMHPEYSEFEVACSC